jgi:transposase
MATKELFTVALGLQSPWYVKDVSFDVDKERLDLFIDFPQGSRFACPECGQADCAVHDTRQRTWRHLDFFQHQAFLTARVPRIRCPACGVKQLPVPWARPGSGFTLAFEIFVLQLAQSMAIKPLAELVSVHPNSLWRIVGHYVKQAHNGIDLSGVTSVGIDECSREKGHQYFTVFGDLNQSRVIFVADSREAQVIEQFAGFLRRRGVDRDQITTCCADMWPPYLQALEQHFSGAAVTFDRYHVMTKMNHALDEVRRAEAKEHTELRGTRYIWLKNQPKLSTKQQVRLERLQHLDLKTVRAYHLKVALQHIWECQQRQEAELFLKRWYFWATHSRLEPIKAFAHTVKNHWHGILNFLDSKITNGIIEGLNSKIKTAMKRAYGFKCFQYLRTIIYLVAGKLALPTRC